MTLKEISSQNPSNYKVIDTAIRKGEVKDWSDKIEIIINHKSKFVTRKCAYKFGLCERT
jgi:hypothetical protein